MSPRTTAQRVLCDAMLAPDGCVIEIGDVGAAAAPGLYVHPDICHEGPTPPTRLWVHTMSTHECDLAGRAVRVRVLADANCSRWGRPTFRGVVNIPSGVLAVGDARNPHRQLLFGSPGVYVVSVFVDYPIPTLQFSDSDALFPVSGPSEITIVMPAAAVFAPAIGNTMIKGPWRQRLPRWWRRPPQTPQAL